MKVSISIRTDLLERIDELRNTHNTSRSGYIQYLIEVALWVIEKDNSQLDDFTEWKKGRKSSN